MVVLEVLFLLLKPAIETGLGAGSDFRLVVASAAIERRQQPLTSRLDFRQDVRRQVALGRILWADIVAGGSRQRLAGIEASIGPIVHLVRFEGGEILVFLGKGLRERVTPGWRDRPRLIEVGATGSDEAQRPDDRHEFQRIHISPRFFSAGPAR